MAVSVAIETNRALRVVAPVIDFRQFRKYRHEEKICPICGKSFKAKLEIFNASPEQGKYCSRECKSIALNQSLTGLVCDAEFKKFLNKHQGLIRMAMNSVLGKVKYIDRSNSFDDHYQSCLITLFLIYSRAVRDKKNPYSIKDNSILLSLKHSMMLDRTQIKNLFNHEEESFFEENVNDEGISNILYFKCDIDKLLDLREILSKIVELAKRDSNVLLALEKAYLYGEKVVDVEANRYLLKKYKLSRDQFFRANKKGIEYIFYNDSKNISRYININNLRNEYSFNTLSEEQLGEEIGSILDFYSGIRRCSYCNKRFKATPAQMGHETAYCSDECKRIGGNLIRKKYKRKQREKNKAPLEERICIHCGKVFKVRATSQKLLCSDECKNLRERELERERRRLKRNK